MGTFVTAATRDRGVVGQAKSQIFDRIICTRLITDEQTLLTHGRQY